jgi:hypothetical protein
MARASELRRQALVSASEINELIPLDSDFPRRVSVKRQEILAAGTPSAGISPTWTTVAGLGNLVGHVRTSGRWVDSETGARIVLGDAERVVMLMDVPAGGDGLADEVLLTDRLIFDDAIKGSSVVWDVKAVYLNKRDGIAICRVEYAREDP